MSISHANQALEALSSPGRPRLGTAAAAAAANSISLLDVGRYLIYARLLVRVGERPSDSARTFFLYPDLPFCVGIVSQQWAQIILIRMHSYIIRYPRTIIDQ